MDFSSNSISDENPTTKQNGFLHPKLGSEPARSRSRAAMASPANSDPKVVTGAAGYILEDVPHLTDYIPNLQVRRRFHRSDFPSRHRPKLFLS